MKKYELKQTPTIILLMFEMFLICLLGGDCEDLTTFFISKIIILIIFLIIAYVLNKYGNKKIIIK